MIERDDEETEEVEQGDLESIPVGPKIDDDAGAVLDRIYDESRRRAMNTTMNERIRRAFGKGG